MTLEAIAHAPGTIQRHPAFPSRYVPPRTVDVWLPPQLSTPSLPRCPVLYMHDGQNLFRSNDAYGGEPWAVEIALDRLITDTVIPPVIVVGVWNIGRNRISEYLPQGFAGTPGGKAFLENHADLFPTAPYADAYLRFLVEELKPWVDGCFNTLPDQAHTCIMGSSMGGLSSLYALSRFPQVFGGAACLSTHWLAGGEPLVDYCAELIPVPGDHRLYFDHGTETLDAGYEPFQQRMDAHLNRLGYRSGADWMTRKFPGAAHNEIAWRERVHIPLEFLFSDFTHPEAAL